MANPICAIEHPDITVETSTECAATQRTYLNTKQASNYLGLSRQFLEIARHKGSGPRYIKLARAVRYRRTDLDAWMADRLQRHTGECTL